jgi:hypothetical protein
VRSEPISYSCGFSPEFAEQVPPAALFSLFSTLYSNAMGEIEGEYLLDIRSMLVCRTGTEEKS